MDRREGQNFPDLMAIVYRLAKLVRPVVSLPPIG
jgi:hypothetical protein